MRLHRTSGPDPLFTVDGIPVSPDVFDRYVQARQRERMRLAASAPKRADPGKPIQPQDDASALDLFRHANEPRLL